MDVGNLDIEISKDMKYKKLLRECYNYAKKSNHPSTHNAALLVDKGNVILKGVNIFPPGVEEKRERLEGENKHLYPNHAERDVIYKAAKKGISTNRLMMVMPWLPCISCANAVISSGIKKLIIHKLMVERTREKWREELKNAAEILNEAGVEIVAYDGPVGGKAYMHGQEWNA